MPTLASSGGVTVSGIREMRDLAAQMTDVVDLAIGEPDMITPAAIGEAAGRAAADGFTKYTATNGLPSLRNALVDKLARQNRITASAAQIVVGTGAACSLSTSLLAVLEAGDEVLVPDPGWPNYTNLVKLAGATAVNYPLARADGYLPDVAALARLVTPRTRVLLINNPGNPTGAVFSRDLVSELVAFAARHDIFLLTDEVYEDFLYVGEHTAAGSLGYDGVISVFSFSKSYAMTGWRLGYAVARPDVAAAITKTQGALVSCASSISQKAGEAALALDHGVLDEMRKEYETRRDIVCATLGDRLVLTPQGAFYALVDVSDTGIDDYTFAKKLLAEEHVSTVPGASFGVQTEGTLRLSFAAARPVVEEGCARIARYLDGFAR
jgi:aspartate/methionine/tyrosine aminotransferase